MSTHFHADRPAIGDYIEYYERYVSLVPDGDIIAILATVRADTLVLLNSISEPKSMFAYAPGKWTIKEALGHVIDAERVFCFRAFWFARNNPTPLPSMEPDDFAKIAGHGKLLWKDLIAEYDHLRSSTIDLFASFDQDSWLRRGIASGAEVSVRGLAWNIAGHDLHHRAMLKLKYLQM